MVIWWWCHEVERRERKKRKVTFMIKHTSHSQAHTQVGHLCVYPPNASHSGLELGFVSRGLALGMYFGLFSKEKREKKKKKSKLHGWSL